MSSLTETAYIARKGVNISVIILIVVIILKIVLGIATDLINKFFPPPPPPATCLFGTLPGPNSQSGIATPSGLIYSQEIVDNPTFPTTLKVYFVPQPASSFSSIGKMKALAAKIGFTDAPRKSGGTLWTFIDPKNPLRTLQSDEVSGDFHLIYNYGSDLSLFNQRNFISQDETVKAAEEFFESAGLLNLDLKKGTPTVTYLKLQNNFLVPTTSLSNADAVEVSLNRTPLDDLPVVSPDLKAGLVSIILSGNSDPTKRVVEAKYYYHSVSSENSATYPTVKLSEVLGQLSPTSAFLASVPNPVTSKFVVRSVSLAYLDPFPAQSYLQPVYVLSDDKGFTSYVPAVRPDCSKQ